MEYMLTLVALAEIFPFPTYFLRQYLSLKWEHSDWPDSKFTSLGRLLDQWAPGNSSVSTMGAGDWYWGLHASMACSMFYGTTSLNPHLAFLHEDQRPELLSLHLAFGWAISPPNLFKKIINPLENLVRTMTAFLKWKMKLSVTTNGPVGWKRA